MGHSHDSAALDSPDSTFSHSCAPTPRQRRSRRFRGRYQRARLPLATQTHRLGICRVRAGARFPDSLYGVSEQAGHPALRRAALADPDPRVRAAIGAGARHRAGCSHAEDRAGCGLVPRRRSGEAAWHLSAGWQPLHHRQPRLYRCGWACAGAPDRRQPGGWTRGHAARRQRPQDAQKRTSGPGAHRHAVRAKAGRAPPGAHGRSARAAGHRPAGGGRPRFQQPSRHRSERHGARGLDHGALRRPGPPRAQAP